MSLLMLMSSPSSSRSMDTRSPSSSLSFSATICRAVERKNREHHVLHSLGNVYKCLRFLSGGNNKSGVFQTPSFFCRVAFSPFANSIALYALVFVLPWSSSCASATCQCNTKKRAYKFKNERRRRNREVSAAKKALKQSVPAFAIRRQQHYQ